MNTDILFINGNLPESFRNLFFGPMEPGEVFETFQDDETMAHLMARTGIFPSISQAAKNGWKKPIPAGFSVVQHKKTRRNIVILNKFDGWNS